MWIVRSIITGETLPLLSKDYNSEIGAGIQLRQYINYHYKPLERRYIEKCWEIIEIDENYKEE